MSAGTINLSNVYFTLDPTSSAQAIYMTGGDAEHLEFLGASGFYIDADDDHTQRRQRKNHFSQFV